MTSNIENDKLITSNCINNEEENGIQTLTLTPNPESNQKYKPAHEFFTASWSIFFPNFVVGRLCSGLNKLLIISSVITLILPTYSLINNAFICYRDHMHIIISLEEVFSATSMFAMYCVVWFGRNLPESKTRCPHCYGHITKHIQDLETEEILNLNQKLKIKCSCCEVCDCMCQGILIFFKRIFFGILNFSSNIFYTWPFTFFTSFGLIFFVRPLIPNTEYSLSDYAIVTCDSIITLVRVFYYQFFCIICARIKKKIECQLNPLVQEMEGGEMTSDKNSCKCYLCLCRWEQIENGLQSLLRFECCKSESNDNMIMTCGFWNVEDDNYYYNKPDDQLQKSRELNDNRVEANIQNEPVKDCTCTFEHDNFVKMKMACIEITNAVAEIDKKIRWFLLLGSVESIIGTSAPLFQLLFALQADNSLATFFIFGGWILLRFILVFFSVYKAYSIPTTYKSYMIRYKKAILKRILDKKCHVLEEKFQFASNNFFKTTPYFTLGGIVSIEALMFVLISAGKLLFGVGIIPLIYEHLKFYKTPHTATNYYFTECKNKNNTQL